MQTGIKHDEKLENQPLLKTKRVINLYERLFKRLIDIFISMTAIIILLPIGLIIAFLVRIKLGSPVIYKHKRPGLNEKIFTLYKFRTMSDARDKEGLLLPDNIRLTKLGRKLRSTSLDELPELFNILKGDMSLIGPRPLVVNYLPYYTVIERLRHSVRPGLSGLAQVNGRNYTTWEQRFAYDVEYTNNITFLGDVKILLKTVVVACKRTGVGVRGLDALIDFDKHRQNQLETWEN